MKTWKPVIAVILLTIVAQIIHTLGASFSMNYYTNPDYFPVWSKIMMPYAGPPPASFMLWALGLGLLTWIIFVAVYKIVKAGIPGNSPVVKGLAFGLLVFLISGFSGSVSLFLMINLPLGLIISWAVEGLLILLVNGVITAVLD